MLWRAIGERFRSVADPATSPALLLRAGGRPEQKSAPAVTRSARRLTLRECGSTTESTETSPLP
jgi:hypothetical protein